MFPARGRISFVGERRDGLLVRGVLRVRIRVLGRSAASGRELAAPIRPSGRPLVATIRVAGVFVPGSVLPAVSEGAISLVLVGAGGVTWPGITLALVLLLGVGLVGVRLVRVGL